MEMGTVRCQKFKDLCDVCKHEHCPGNCNKPCPVYSEDLNGCVCIRTPTQAELCKKECDYFAPCNPKFKVGDKVRFVRNITPSIEKKNEWIGRVFEIDRVLPFDSAALKDWPYSIGELYVAHEPELELYEENKKEKEPMEKKIMRSEKFARQCETCVHDGSSYECRKCKCEDCICNTEDDGCQCNEWASPMELDAGMCAYYKKTEDKIKVTMEEIHAVFGIGKDVKIYIVDSTKESDKIFNDHVAVTFKIDKWEPISAPDDHTLAFQLSVNGFNKSGKHVIKVLYPRVEIAFDPKFFGTKTDAPEAGFYWDDKRRFVSDGRTFLKTLYPDCPLTVKPDSGTFDGVEYKYAYYITKETEPYRVIYTDDLKRKFSGDVEVVPAFLKTDDFYKGDKVIYIGDNGTKNPQKGDIGEVIRNDHSDIIPIACHFPTRLFTQTIDGVNGWWCNRYELAKICEDQTHFAPGDMVIMMDDRARASEPEKFTIGVVRRITNYPGATSPSLLIEWPEGSVMRNSLTEDYTWACTARHVLKIRKVGQDK